MNGRDLVGPLRWMTQISLYWGISSRYIKLETSVNGLGFYRASEMDDPQAFVLDSLVWASKSECMC